MKYLTLIRHAKAANVDGTAGDRNRPLAERGIRDGHSMGSVLAARFPSPDIVLASPARRVIETLAALAAGGVSAATERTEYHDALYLAEKETIVDFSGSALMQFREAWIVCHNPGITEALEELSGARLENIPTLGVARIAFDEIVYESLHGKLVYFEAPRSH